MTYHFWKKALAIAPRPDLYDASLASLRIFICAVWSLCTFYLICKNHFMECLSGILDRQESASYINLNVCLFLSEEVRLPNQSFKSLILILLVLTKMQMCIQCHNQTKPTSTSGMLFSRYIIFRCNDHSLLFPGKNCFLQVALSLY
jgi:hypothetical protein